MIVQSGGECRKEEEEEKGACNSREEPQSSVHIIQPDSMEGAIWWDAKRGRNTFLQ